MAIQPKDCSVFIQVWVDTNAAAPGSTAGIYLVDNQLTRGSTGEGTPALMTHATQNSAVCFSVMNIDPQSSATLEITNISSSGAFGFDGAPQRFSSHTWIGTLAKPVANADYSLSFNITKAGGEHLSTTVSAQFQIT